MTTSTGIPSRTVGRSAQGSCLAYLQALEEQLPEGSADRNTIQRAVAIVAEHGGVVTDKREERHPAADQYGS